MFLVRWEICHLLCWEFQCSLVRPLGLGLPRVTGTEEGIELAGFCDKDLSGCDNVPLAARGRCSWLAVGWRGRRKQLESWVVVGSACRANNPVPLFENLTGKC